MNNEVYFVGTPKKSSVPKVGRDMN